MYRRDKSQDRAQSAGIPRLDSALVRGLARAVRKVGHSLVPNSTRHPNTGRDRRFGRALTADPRVIEATLHRDRNFGALSLLRLRLVLDAPQFGVAPERIAHLVTATATPRAEAVAGQPDAPPVERPQVPPQVSDFLTQTVAQLAPQFPNWGRIEVVIGLRDGDTLWIGDASHCGYPHRYIEPHEIILTEP